MNNPESKVAITIEQFKTFFNTYREVNAYLSLDETTQKYVKQKEDWIDRLKQEEFPVAFLGVFAAGKSTIINSILGKEILPEAPQSTTAFPTILRKGETEIAYVYYIDEAAKISFWNQLCAEIGLKIDKRLDRRPQENYEAHLHRIRAEAQKYAQSTNSKIDNKPIQTLEELFQGWKSEKYASERSISLSDLQQYVEGHEDSLFIDRIEVFLPDVNIPSDVVLVDLPGLAVANQRHKDFTKEYIQDKAKAFVVCMKPKHLLEGEEIQFLEETHRKNPTILQRSFWVINQWDTLNDLQKQEEAQNFAQKVKQYGFSINYDRFFKFSALNYLLLTCLMDGTLGTTEKLKSHRSNLKKMTVTEVEDISPEQAQMLLENYEEVQSFSLFKQTLFNYLDTVAKDEFIADARSELLKLSEMLEKVLKPLHEQHGESSDLDAEIHSVEISRQVSQFVETLREKIQSFAKQVRVSQNGTFWKDADTSQVEKEVARKISQINREELKNILREGMDRHEGDLSELPAFMNRKVGVSLLLREKMTAIVDSYFVLQLRKFLLELKEINKEYLPESVLDGLANRLGNRDIVMRLNGLADSLFYDYGKELERIGLNLYECQGSSLEARIDAALSNYESELGKLVKSLAKDLNKYACGSIKNHVEYLKEDLLELLTQSNELITTQVARKVKVSEAVAVEKQRRSAVENGYVAVVNLKNEL